MPAPAFLRYVTGGASWPRLIPRRFLWFGLALAGGMVAITNRAVSAGPVLEPAATEARGPIFDELSQQCFTDKYLALQGTDNSGPNGMERGKLVVISWRDVIPRQMVFYFDKNNDFPDRDVDFRDARGIVCNKDQVRLLYIKSGYAKGIQNHIVAPFLVTAGIVKLSVEDPKFTYSEEGDDTFGGLSFGKLFNMAAGPDTGRYLNRKAVITMDMGETVSGITVQLNVVVGGYPGAYPGEREPSQGYTATFVEDVVLIKGGKIVKKIPVINYENFDSGD